MITRINKVVNPVLSILVCTLPERAGKYNALIAVLKAQADRTGEVEIISDNTERGVITTGLKRMTLLNSANGVYSAFVDDDDMVSSRYVQLILEGAKYGTDCIGITGILKRNGISNWTFRHSITVSRWCKDKAKMIYFRTPNHLNPIKTDIARLVGFKNITIGEDRDYSDRIRPYLKNEFYIEEPIYYYMK